MTIERSWKAICAATILALTLTTGTTWAARKKGSGRHKGTAGMMGGQHRGARGQGPRIQRDGGTMGHDASSMGQHENDDMGQHQGGSTRHDSGGMEQQHGGGMMEKD